MVPGRRPFFGSYARAFRNILDRPCVENGKDIWVEKTPDHLPRLQLITRVLPEARFIHILRDGRDVVASLLQSISEGPVEWNWPVGDVEYYIDRWNADVNTSLRYRHDPCHALIKYEALLVDPEGELRRLCQFMGVSFDPDMLRYQDAATLVLGPAKREAWRRDVFDGLKATHLRKFNSVFSGAGAKRYPTQAISRWRDRSPS